MIKLPSRDTDEGIESRVLLAECHGPAYASFNLADATQCMQMMDLVLWNRVENPKPFGAKAKKLLDVVKAKGQFRGFENYPNYLPAIASQIQNAIDIANNSKDRRSLDYVGFINSAINIAQSPSTIGDPSPGTLVAWRTAGSGSPGSGFLKHATIAAIDFYYQ